MGHFYERIITSEVFLETVIFQVLICAPMLEALYTEDNIFSKLLYVLYTNYIVYVYFQFITGKQHEVSHYQ